MVRDGSGLEGMRQLMCEPHITPELFKVKGEELPPAQNALCSSAASAIKAISSGIISKVQLLRCGSGVQRILSAGYGAAPRKHTCAFGSGGSAGRGSGSGSCPKVILCHSVPCPPRLPGEDLGGVGSAALPSDRFLFAHTSQRHLRAADNRR